MSRVERRKYAFEELDDIANAPTRGRWSVDRVEVLKGAIRLAIKHAREDLRESTSDLHLQIYGPEDDG